MEGFEISVDVLLLTRQVLYAQQEPLPQLRFHSAGTKQEDVQWAFSNRPDQEQAAGLIFAAVPIKGGKDVSVTDFSSADSPMLGFVDEYILLFVQVPVQLVKKCLRSSLITWRFQILVEIFSDSWPDWTLILIAKFRPLFVILSIVLYSKFSMPHPVYERILSKKVIHANHQYHDAPKSHPDLSTKAVKRWSVCHNSLFPGLYYHQGLNAMQFVSYFL